MTNNDALIHCIAEITQCTKIEEVFDVLDKYGIEDVSEWVYCCIAASCANRKEINLLEKQISAAESALLMQREKFCLKFLKTMFKP